MADSIRQAIVEHLRAAVEAINGQGSYLHALTGGAYRWQAVALDLAGQSPAAVVDWISESKIADETAAGPGHVRKELTVQVDLWLSPVKDGIEPASHSVWMDEWAADAEAAVMADPGRGGLAEKTEVTEIQRFPSQDESRIGVSLVCKVQFLINENDPRTQ